MSKLLKHSALKLFSLTFLFLFFISAESKETIDLQKYLIDIEIVKDYQDRKIGYRNSEGITQKWVMPEEEAQWFALEDIHGSVGAVK